MLPQCKLCNLGIAYTNAESILPKRLLQLAFYFFPLLIQPMSSVYFFFFSNEVDGTRSLVDDLHLHSFSWLLAVTNFRLNSTFNSFKYLMQSCLSICFLLPSKPQFLLHLTLLKLHSSKWLARCNSWMICLHPTYK